MLRTAGVEEAVIGRYAKLSFTLTRLARSPTFLAGVAIVAFWVVMAFAWRWVAPRDPQALDPTHLLSGPSAAHWLGTDQLGRDVLSRVLAGSQSVLTVAPAATLLAVTAGTLIGVMAGYYGGISDDLLMRFVDAQLAFPGLIVAVVVLGSLGASELNVVLVIAIFFAPLVGRVARSAALGEREKEYVSAARMRGERGYHIMLVEILPNITGPIVVEATVRLGYAVFTAATLSFLGLGLQPPSPDWGRTISEERTYIIATPWPAIAPAIALATLVIGVNLMTDGCRKALRD
jgi:peptide/nickel transport system permease protein